MQGFFYVGSEAMVSASSPNRGWVSKGNGNSLKQFFQAPGLENDFAGPNSFIKGLWKNKNNNNSVYSQG